MKLTESQLQELLEIERLSFKEGDQFSKRQFKYLFDNAHTRLLYFKQGALAGYLIAFSYKKSNRIYSLAIHPNYRKEGIGSYLLLDLEEDSHPKPIQLEVRKDSRNAIKFYKKHGYKPYGIKHNYYADGTDAILMRKEFGNAQRRLAESSDIV